MNSARYLIITGLAALLLTGCSSLGLESDPTYGDKDHDQLYKNGSLLSDNGGIDLLGGDSSKKAVESGGIGVNGFLWRATLDTISFMPMVSADPFGGVIITDWYSPAGNTNERTKLNVYIRDRELHADGIKVVVFRQVKGIDGVWTDASVAPNTASSLENAILTRARQVRVAQKQFE